MRGFDATPWNIESMNKWGESDHEKGIVSIIWIKWYIWFQMYVRPLTSFPKSIHPPPNCPASQNIWYFCQSYLQPWIYFCGIIPPGLHNLWICPHWVWQCSRPGSVDTRRCAWLRHYVFIPWRLIVLDWLHLNATCLAVGRTCTLDTSGNTACQAVNGPCSMPRSHFQDLKQFMHEWGRRTREGYLCAVALKNTKYLEHPWALLMCNNNFTKNTCSPHLLVACKASCHSVAGADQKRWGHQHVKDNSGEQKILHWTYLVRVEAFDDDPSSSRHSQLPPVHLKVTERLA